MATIAIDARKYFDYGIGTYIQQLIKHLSELPSPHSFMMFVSPTDASRIEVPHGWQAVAADHPKYSLREALLLGYAVKRHGGDLFHVPHYTLPIGLKGKSIVTIHDLIHLKFPQYFNAIERMYARLMLRHAVRNAGAVITVSEFTRQEIMDVFDVSAGRIHVIYNAAGDEFAPISNEGELEDFRRAYQLTKPFVLYVGSLKPHKNVSVLLRAFRDLTASLRDVELVFVGGSVTSHPQLSKEIHELGIMHRVKELGQISRAHLIFTYNTAEVLVMPSLHEGFGLPALEAMACGTPVVAARAGSLPEVVGDAAVMFEPRDRESLREALAKVLLNPSIKADLRSRGIQNARRFSWKTTAAQTVRVYESLLS